jgi:hypothetical protein
VTDANISAIRAKLRFDNIEDFIQGYSQYISTAGLYIPMAPEKFKPMDSVVRFQFLLADGTSTALLGEGTVVHHQHADPATPETPPGILVKFNKLSPSSKQTVERIVRLQAARQSQPFITLSEPAPPRPPEREPSTTPVPVEPPHAEPQYLAPQQIEPPQPVEEPQLAQPSEPVIAPPSIQSPFDSGSSMSAPRSAMFEDALASLFGDDEPADPRRATRPGDSNPFASQPGLIAASQPDLGAMPSQPGLDSPSEGTRQPKTLGQTERGIQIMAYDQATEQANVDLSALVGGEDDDIDSMFDDIFGGPSQAKEVPATAAAATRSAPSFLSGPVAAVSREPVAPAAPAPGVAPSKELLGLLDSFEGSEPDEDAPSINALDLHAGTAARIEREVPAEGSLESLLALARKDLETPQEKKSSRDILDDLLGDDLPPPPTADEAFSLPPSPAEANKDKKQGGFFSRLFGNSDK